MNDTSVRIPLTKGQVAIVDAMDAGLVNRYRWYYSTRAQGHPYANTTINEGGKTVRLSMHRLIMGAVAGQVVDHINGDTLDNRRSNLRLADTQRNSWNHGSQNGSKSQYRGVSFYDNRFVARIFVDGRNQSLGNYTDERLAARVYDYAATMHFGEFARLNLPGEPLLSAEEFERLSSRRPKLSAYRGVSWAEDKSRWRAYIQVNSKFVWLGYHASEHDAASAYNEAAVKYHGDKAKLNILP